MFKTADVKWIKLAIDIFDNRKIRQIEKMPEGDSIIVIWVKMLCLAGNINDNGLIYLTREIPYTEDMLATEFNRPLMTVQLALRTFERFKMIEIIDDIYHISSWERYQNVAGLEKIREQTRLRVAKHREKKKREMESLECQYCGSEATGYDHILALSRGGTDDEWNKVPCCLECNRIKNDKPVVDFLNRNRERIRDDIVTGNQKLMRFVTLCNATDRYKETQSNGIEIDTDKNKKEEKENISNDSKESLYPLTGEQTQKKDDSKYQWLVDAWNELEIYGIPPVRKISASSPRVPLIRARLKQYSEADVLEAIENIKYSDFLLGKKTDFRITFDWFIKPKNFPKVLEGNYNNNNDSRSANMSKASKEFQADIDRIATWAERRGEHDAYRI